MKPIRIFIRTAGAILFGAALIRFIIATGDVQSLSLPEPLLGIPLRFAVLIVGIVELAVAMVCLFGKQTGFQIVLLAWVSAAFITYQVGLHWEHLSAQGTGIGSLTDPLRLARGIPGYLMTFLPFYVVLGTCTTGSWLAFSKTARTGRRVEDKQNADDHDAAAGLMRMLCPSCGGHIKFPGQSVGQQMACPHCKAAIILRKPELLKMSCFFCQGHIEFPAHAIGERLQCPHCQKDITLNERI